MKMKRIISSLLAVLMILSAGTLLIGAAETNGEAEAYTYNTGDGQSLMAPSGMALEPYAYKTGEYSLADGSKGVIQTPEDKLKTMDYRYGNDKYQLYVDAYSGEIAVKNRATGELLFSNPYNIGDSTASDASTQKGEGTKNELLSQIIVSFTNIKDKDAAAATYNSYYWAACRDQISVKSIKNGIRVEYSLGREVSETVVPQAILQTSAEEKIFNVIEEAIEWHTVAMDPYSGDPIFDENSPFYREQFEYTKLRSFYELQDPSKAVIPQRDLDFWAELGVDLNETPIYRLKIENPAENENQIRRLESFIKRYCPDYTVDEKNADYADLGGFEEEKIEAALFRMALEYTLDDNGLVVTLPANGIRFDETKYRLNDIQVLPYMGAGMNPNPGYTFFPDGSGALFDFATIAELGNKKDFTGKIYGEDYAYHEIEGKLMEIVRYPVFGLVEEQTFVSYEYDVFGNVIKETPYQEMRGFVAVVEEGASLMQLTSSHGGPTSEYNTIKISVKPRPTDSFNLQDSVSVAENRPYTVVSDRKYTGSYKIRYKMLTDDTLAAENGVEDYYECSYMGMAKAYREYLESQGVLTRLTAADVEENMPLYIETFGAFKTTKKILSIPVEVMAPLTSFKDISTMYDSLAEDGVSNVNFVMKGYRKGGLSMEAVPYNLKWEGTVEKDMDFEELLAYAKEKGFGIYPDADFVFANANYNFDGYSLSDHAAKTIDNRYTSKREYSATQHTYTSFFEMALSSASFSHFYEKFIPEYNEYDPMGLSISTLGSYLNSDFDEDDPYNRADTEDFTVEAFAYIRKNMPNAKLLTSGGNAYSWKYVDHITDIALDSSRIDFSTASVPFLGMVLHGYVEIAGTPFNTEGNLDYAFLKTLESGAALKFLLSYQNTAGLKEYEMTSKYYSIRYDIWYNDMVSKYTKLNSLIKDVQTSVIVDHKFLDGVRVADDDEMVNDIITDLDAALKYEQDKKLAAAEAKREKIFNARLTVIEAINEIKSLGGDLIAHTDAELANGATPNMRDTFNTQKQAVLEYLNKEGLKFTDVRGAWNRVVGTRYSSTAYTIIATAQKLSYLYESIETMMKYLESEKDFDRAYYDDLRALIDDAEFQALCDKIMGRGTTSIETEIETEAQDLFDTMVNNAQWGKGEKTKFNKDQYKIDLNYEILRESNEVDNVIAIETPSFNNESRYEATPYTIVYQEYENGTSFLMNFNDYRVIVVFEGRTYTIEAYGYIVLSQAA
ncbi:MAG: hypothetical protein J6Q82_01155 [Clostridia bacterium]|nr:hypothetical protein [Clostridia bacterium]